MSQRTPLYEEHRRLGARIVDFAGFEMPVQYTGVIEEHLAVRRAAGLFDVSHMGEFEFAGPDAEACLQWLTPNDVSKLTDGMAQYSMLLNERGGIVDDILVYRENGERFILVVNASNMEKDFSWVQQKARGKNGKPSIRNLSDTLSLIALQGPKAIATISLLTKLPIASLKPFRFAIGAVAGQDRCWVARTGYTGEDGVEIFCANAQAVPLWRAILSAGGGPAFGGSAGKNYGVVPAGLGARDTLRLEARLSLYGHEITDETNPLEAGLSWVIKLNKPGDFLGKGALLKIHEQGLSRQIVGFKMVDKGIPRQGYPISDGSQIIGTVTSGTHSPTLGFPIGLGYVAAPHSAVGSQFYIDIRKGLKLAEVVPTPFYRRPATV